VKSTFRPHLLELRVRLGSLTPTVDLGVDEVASLPVHAVTFREKHSAFFSFVFRVGLLIFAELVRSMGKLALLLVGAEAEFQIFFAEL
jgi:hypothetical protein